MASWWHAERIISYSTEPITLHVRQTAPGGSKKKKKPFVSEGRACNVVLFPRGESYQPQTHSQASHQMNDFAISDCVQYGTSSGPEELQPAVIVIFNCQLSHHPLPTGVQCSCQMNSKTLVSKTVGVYKGQYRDVMTWWQMSCSKTNNSFGYCAIQLHEHATNQSSFQCCARNIPTCLWVTSSNSIILLHNTFKATRSDFKS